MSGQRQGHGVLVPFSFPVSFSFSTSITDKPKNPGYHEGKSFLLFNTLNTEMESPCSCEFCSLSDV